MSTCAKQEKRKSAGGALDRRFDPPTPTPIPTPRGDNYNSSWYYLFLVKCSLTDDATRRSVPGGLGMRGILMDARSMVNDTSMCSRERTPCCPPESANALSTIETNNIHCTTQH